MKTLFAEMVAALLGGAMDASIDRLYGQGERLSQKERCLNLLQEAAARFSPREAVLLSAPGRTELGGNHTDHNGGIVLAAAVHLDTTAVASSREDTKATVYSSRIPVPIQVDLQDLSPRAAEKGTPKAIIRGVAAAFAGEGLRIGGFNACVHSTIPMGTGLSSSASFAVLMGLALSHLFNGGEASEMFLARAALAAETRHFGKPCGFMDQMTVAHRGILYMDFRDADDPRVKQVPDFFPARDTCLAVVDTGGSHVRLTEEYADIRREMAAVAACLGKESTRGLTSGQVVGAVPRLRSEAGDRAILRTLHFLAENRRVARQMSALKRGLMKKFLESVNESGHSSWELLQNHVVPGEVRVQSIPLALALTRQFLKGDGACRVHGGGFAGTIQAYVPRDREEEYRRLMESVFGPCCFYPLRIRPPDAPVLLKA